MIVLNYKLFYFLLCKILLVYSSCINPFHKIQVYPKYICSVQIFIRSRDICILYITTNLYCISLSKHKNEDSLFQTIVDLIKKLFGFSNDEKVTKGKSKRKIKNKTSKTSLWQSNSNKKKLGGNPKKATDQFEIQSYICHKF